MKILSILFVSSITFVFSFSLNAQNWNQVVKNAASDRDAGDYHGYSVSISGDYAVVGAYKEDHDVNGANSENDAGAAYILEKDNLGNWVEEQKICASDRASGDHFGFDVAISGDYLVIGANLEDHNVNGGGTKNHAGSAYVFERNSSGVWTEVQKIVASDRDKKDFFGYSVSISGNYISIGAYLENEDPNNANSLGKAGSAYVFERNNSGTWYQVIKIVASDRDRNDYFGYSIDISGNYIIVGAYGEGHDVNGGNSMNNSGSAYIFERSISGLWSEAQKITASDRDVNNRFGQSVAIEGDFAIVGAYYEDPSNSNNSINNAGVAYLYERSSAGTWAQIQKLSASDAAVNDRFGYNVEISGNYAVVGALNESEDASGSNSMSHSGSAYVFERNTTTGVWAELQKIVAADRAANDHFGVAVSVSTNNLIVGAYKDDEDGLGSNPLSDAGSVYVFEMPASNVVITTSTIAAGDWTTASSWDCNCVPPANSNVVINHDMTLNSDMSFDESNYLNINYGKTLTVNSPYSITNDGDFENNGTLEGSISLGGTVDRNVKIGTVDQVEINASATLTLDSDMEVSEVLKLSSGILATNNYELLIKSDASGDALVVDNGGTLLGDATVQRYIDNGLGHHFLTSPVSNADLSELGDDFTLNLTSAYPFIYYYDETNTSPFKSEGWSSPSSSSDPMTVGMGFSGYFSADGGRTIDITGSLNSGSVSIPITNTSSGDPLSDGWNFIGNPFASPVDFDLVIQSAPASVEDALYRWNPVLEQYVAYVDKVSSSSSFNSIIPSMQGFWIKTDASANLVIDASMRVEDPAVNGTFLKSGSDNNPLFRLQLNGQGYSLESVVRYKPNASNMFDSQFDAHYLSSDVPGSPEFASASDVGPLTINTRLPFTNTPDLIPLHCVIATDGIYSISLTEISNFNQNDLIILEDVLLGTTHVLNQSAYTFVGSTLDAATRFIVRVVPAMMTSVDDVTFDESIQIFKCNDNLCINLLNAIDQPQLVNIYNKVGQLVFSTRLESGLLNYSLNNLNLNVNDIYLVKLESMDSAVKLKW